MHSASLTLAHNALHSPSSIRFGDGGGPEEALSFGSDINVGTTITCTHARTYVRAFGINIHHDLVYCQECTSEHILALPRNIRCVYVRAWGWYGAH